MNRLHPALAVVSLILAAVLPYARSIRHTFVFDDIGAILTHPGVTGGDLGAIWGRPYWVDLPRGGLYRPVTTMTFAIDHAIGGGDPGTFHATNLLLHALAVLAAYGLLRSLFPGRPGLAWVASALFAVHPIHVEPVAWIVGRAEILAALGVIASYRLWLAAERATPSRWGWTPSVLWVLSLLAKESAVALPLLFFAHRRGWIQPASPSRGFRRWDAAWLVGLGLVIALRLRVLGATQAPRPTWFDNPLAHVGSIERMLGSGAVLARQLLQVMTLRGFAAEYAYGEVSPGPRLYALGGITLALLAAVTVGLLRRGRHSPEAWGLAFFLCFWLPTSNFLVAIGTVQADRLLYLPLLGLLAAAAAALARLRPLRRTPRLALAVAAVALLGCGLVSCNQTGVWRDQPALFRAAIRAAPRNVKVRAHLATLILGEKTPEHAREALALITPVRALGADYGPLLQREAEARMVLGEYEPAGKLYRDALRRGADSTDILIELGNIALLLGKGDEGLAAFEAADRTGKKRQHAAIGRASALSLLGRYGEAADAWLPLATELPDSIPVRVACAWNLRMAGRGREAVELLRAAARQDARITEELEAARRAAGGSEE